MTGSPIALDFMLWGFITGVILYVIDRTFGGF